MTEAQENNKPNMHARGKTTSIQIMKAFHRYMLGIDYARDHQCMEVE
jgi:hypothetical protein